MTNVTLQAPQKVDKGAAE